MYQCNYNTLYKYIAFGLVFAQKIPINHFMQCVCPNDMPRIPPPLARHLRSSWRRATLRGDEMLEMGIVVN